jgi:hypothetical protein
MSDSSLTNAQIEAANLADWRPILPGPFGTSVALGRQRAGAVWVGANALA